MWKIAIVIIFGIFTAVVAMFLLLQLVPYGRDHTNPPVIQEPAWSSPAARDLAVRACYDCHSNETVWPWYSNIAPMSWLVQRDVMEGREKLNFSEWNRPQEEVEEIAEVVAEGEMPPLIYYPTHPTARLNAAEKQLLMQELERFAGMFGGESEDDD